MSTTITPGFTGYASSGGEIIRFNTCSLNATQEVEAPDMVMGDYTHNAWAYGKIEVAGRISGPMTENTMNFIAPLWNTQTGSSVDVVYYSGRSRSFSGILANSITINVTAGDVVNFDLELIGKTKSEGTSGGTHTKTEKLLTWDKAAFYIGNSDMVTNDGYVMPDDSNYTRVEGLQSFSITFTRNVTRQFIIGESSLFGDLVRGMSAITGQLVQYFPGSLGGGKDFWNDYFGYSYYPFRFSLGDVSIATPYTLARGTVAFHRATTELGVGPLLSTIGMTGVGHFSGAPDSNIFG